MSLFHDDVLPLSDGGMNVTTLKEQYMLENPNVDMDLFDPTSAKWRDPDFNKDAQYKHMKQFVTNKIMDMSKTFYNNNSKKSNKNQSKLFTEDNYDMTMSDGSVVEVDKGSLNNAVNMLRNPLDGNSFTGWDGSSYSYDASKENGIDKGTKRTTQYMK